MKRNHCTFIIGGTRSGKSGLAVERAKKLGRHVLFVATCVPRDEEMKKRVRSHKRSRPRSWRSLEAGGRLAPELRSMKDPLDAVIIDCVGLFVSNLMEMELSDTAIIREVRMAIRAIRKISSEVIIVSNDVGSGIVPANAAARRFGDIIGLANQMIAQEADEVIVMHSGIPTRIKGGA
ncbi:MAG: bifunctional adenosylcobinamide kinase/adenosylcobinamide-phosphate guanylyltransferase [Candidatus Omnitrophota bacterium]